MLIKYVAFGLAKLALVFLLPGYLVGAASTFFPPEKRGRGALFLLAGLFLILETAVFLEKGLPFFFGNIYNMVSMNPILAVHLPVGLACDALWIGFSFRLAKKTAQKITLMRNQEKA